MKSTWTVAKLLKTHPACRKVILDYDLVLRDVATTSLADLADEIEEDLDDFMDELDHAANVLNDADPAIVGDGDDDLPDEDEEYDDAEEDDDGDDEPLDADSPVGDVDEVLGDIDDEEEEDGGSEAVSDESLDFASGTR